MANNRNEAPSLLPTAAQRNVQRAVKTWLNTCTQLPDGAGGVTFEDLPENACGICFATVQAPYYAARYILGGYRAEYNFRIIYRVLPSDDGDMLDAVEALTDVAAWCDTAEPPEIEGADNARVTVTSDAAILAAYEDGSNDYSVNLTLTWEVFT